MPDKTFRDTDYYSGQIDPMTGLQLAQGIPESSSYDPMLGVWNTPHPTIQDTGAELTSKYDTSVQPFVDINRLRGERQSGFAQLGSAINQAVVGQVVGGTVEGIGYLLDFEQYANLAKGTEQEFGNWFSDIGKSLQTWTQEETPVYTTYEPGSFSPDHWSWWMNNVPSVASTLSLLIPAAGATRGLSMLGKAAKIGRELGVAERWAAKGITQAIVSRHMESMMDSNQTYNDVLNKSLSSGMSDEESKKKASIAASSVYKMEWASLAQDIPQYLLLNRSFSTASLENTIGIARKMGKTITPVIGKKTAAIGWDMLTEGGEEAFQYIAQKEGEYLANTTYDPSLKRLFSDRLDSYLADGDLWTQGFFGAVGAGVVQTTGHAINKAIIGNKDPRIEDIQSWGSQFSYWNQRMKEAQTDGDTNAERFTKDALWSTLGTKAATVGNARNAMDFLEAMKSPTQEELDRFGVDENDLKVFQSELPKGIEKIKRIEKIYNDNSKLYNPDKAQLVTYHQALLEDQINNRNRLESLSNQDRSMIPNLDILPPHVKDYLFHEVDSRLINKRIKFFEKALNRSETESEEAQYQKNIDKLKTQLSTVEAAKKDIESIGGFTKTTINNYLPQLESKAFEDYRRHTQELEYSRHAISDLQSDLERIKRDDFISTPEERTKYTQQAKEEQEENKVYQPSIDDMVVYTAPDESISLHKINEIDEEENATITPVDETGNPTGDPDIIVDRNNLTLFHKEGAEELDQPETINWDETPEVEKTLYDEPGRGLRDVSTSISHSHWEPSQRKTIVRNKAFDIHVSTPSNDLKGDNVSFSIDTNVANVATDERYRKALEKTTKTVNDKINNGEKFTKVEINNIVNTIRLTNNEDRFNSLVDIIPIKISYKTKDNQIFDTGLYYHDTNFIHRLSGGGWNIVIPSDVEDVEAYIQSEREKVRKNRKILLTALLSGKEVILYNIGKTMGIPNNTGVNRRIDEVLKQDANEIKLGIVDSTERAWTGQGNEDMKGKGTPGNILFETNKTCNGETGTIKCNISKLSPEHAAILWDVLITRSHRGSGGNQAVYKTEDVEGLTIGQVLKLLTNFGPKTNINHPNKVGKEYLKNKQLFIDNKLILHYGENTVDIHDIFKNRINITQERENFINWATKNKNYTITKEIPELGIELNKPMKKKFKLGSWVSEGNDNYSGFLIKNGIVQTDVDEFENTGSLYHAPVTIIDISESGYEVIPAKPIIKKAKATAKEIETQSNKPSTNPKNTGTTKVTSTKTGELTVSPTEINKLKSLPIGTDIYLNIHSKLGVDEDKDIITPVLVLSVVDSGGIKSYRLKGARLRTAFGISIESFQQDPEPIIEISDQSVSKISTVLTNYKDYSINVPKEIETKEPDIKEESTIEEFTPDIKKSDVITGYSADPITDINSGNEAPFKLAYTIPPHYEIIDIQKETRWLRDKLGNIPVEIVNGLIYMSKGNRIAIGQMKRDSIALSNVAMSSTSYHEAFHRVSLLYLDEETRGSIYNEARKRYTLTNQTDSQVEEVLAEKFREYVIDRESESPRLTFFGKIAEFFKNLYLLVKHVFTGSNRLTDLDIDKLFQSIQSGKFRYNKPSKENLDRLGFGTYELEYKDRQLNNVVNFKMFRSLVRGLSSIVMKDVSTKLFREYTPDNINTLNPNEVFVFGSNAEGVHGKGAALLAKQKFGAVQGQSEGLQGQSYAIITKKDWRVEKSSTLQEIQSGLEKMLKFASNNPSKKFLVTKLGSSLAGYTINEIRQIFENLKTQIPNNVILPKEYEVRDQISKYAAVDVTDSIQSINFNSLKNRIEKLVDDYSKHAEYSSWILKTVEKGQLTPKLASQLKDMCKVDSISNLTLKVNHGLENALRLADLYQEVVDNYENIYKDAIEEYIYNELGIRKVNKEGEDRKVDNREIARFDEESYERSAKDSISNSIKFLISNLHESTEVDQLTGLYKFVEFDEIWSRLMNDIHSRDNIEDMMKILESKDYFPYQQLVKKLKNGSELLRTQFYTSIHRHRHSFINVMFSEFKEKGKLPNFNMYFTDADIQNAAKNTVNTWGEIFALSNLFDEDKLDQKKLNKIFDNYNQLKKDYKTSNDNNPLVNTTEFKDRLISILNDIHIEVDSKTIDDLISDIIKSGKTGTEEKALGILIDRDIFYLFSKDSTLYKYATGQKIESKSKGVQWEPKTLFKNESVVSKIATSFAKTNYENISDNVPGAEGNNHHVFSENSYVTDIVRYLKTNDKFLDDKFKDVYSRFSEYLDQLKTNKDIKDGLQVKTFNAFIKDGTPDTGRNYIDITPIEDFLYKLNLIRSGYFVFPTMASRRTYYMLKGLKRIELKYQKEGDNLVIPDEIIDVFYKYALAEKNRIDNAWRTLEKYSDLDENGNIIKVNDFTNLVENYHYVTEGKVKNWHKGLAYKYQHMFNSFNKKGFVFDEVSVKNSIRNILQNDINETIEFARNNDIVRFDKGKLSSVLVDNGMVTELAKEYAGDKDNALRSILADYTINTKISSIETMMIFMGDVAFYKPDNSGNPAEDYAKRLSVLTSSGSTPREIIPVEYESPVYNVTTLTEQKIPSIYYEAIRKVQKRLLLPKYNNDEVLVDRILDKVLRDYTKVSPTDAQVLITPDMFKGDSIRRGKWSDKIDIAFNMLQSDKVLTAEEEQEALNIVMQPLKHVYFDTVSYDIDDNNKVLIPTYDKMAIFTLFRRYVNGTHLEELLDRMELKGKYASGNLEKICMVKFSSAVKVGNRLTTEYFKNPDTFSQSINDLTKLPVYYQKFKFLRNQTATDPHEIQKVLLASQFKKITQANIDDNADYIIDGKSIKGKDIKNNITNSLINLSDKETHRLLDKLGVDEDGKMNEDLFYNSLLSDAKVSGMPENVQESIRRHIPIDLLPERKWIFQRFAAMINKYGIDLHLPGQQLIQMSGFGLGSKSITDQTNNLKFLFDNKDKENPKIIGTECKLSVQIFKDIIPGYENKSWEDKVKWLKDNPEVLEGIGYRIPNQGQSSSIFLKIKEFLPESSGDVIILPNEFTALTGSDFDVDKVFFIRYNYKTDKDGKVSKVPFMTDDNSTIDQRYNKILDESFYDNKFIFSKESYEDFREIKDNIYSSLNLKSRLLGDEDGSKLSTLYDKRNELYKQLDKSSNREKEFYHRQIIDIDSRIDDLLYYKNIINEDNDVLKDYRDIIEKTLVKYNLLPSREEFKKLHSNGSINYFQQNTKQAIQNYYLDNVKAILLSEQHFLSTSAPLGAVTGRLKSLAEKVRDAEQLDKEKSFDFTGPVYQSNLKFKFASGSLGKGSFSLSNSHHVISQLANISFNRDIKIGKVVDGKTSLHETEGVIEKDGQRILISDWGSALIDSQVDIEKDPYIIDLNVVQPTYNVVQLLIRLGVGEKTFEFTSQPILKDLSIKYINEVKEGNELGVRKFDKPITIIRDKWNDLYDNSLKKLGSVETRNAEDARIKEKYTDYKPLEDDLLKLLQSPVRDAEWYYKQLKIVDLFHTLDKGAAKDLNRLVMASRVDTKKWGSNFIETKMYIDSIRSLYDDKLFSNLNKLLPFDPETETSTDVEDGTFNSAYLRNGPLLFTKLMEGQTITSTKPFNDIIDRIIILTKNKFAKNKEGLMNHISDELHSALLSRFFSDKGLLNLDSKKVATIMGKVVHFLSTVNSNPKYKELLKDNVLVQSLVKGKTTVDGLVFFGIPTIKSDDNFVKEDLTFAWQELLQSDDPTLRDFAKELFVYSFYTSGFKRGIYSIFHYIPPSLFQELEYTYTNIETGEVIQDILNFSKYTTNLLHNLQNLDIVDSIVANIDKEIFKNNWYDSRYVEQLYTDDLKSVIETSKTKRPAIGTVDDIDIKKGLYLGKNELNQPVFKSYINYHTNDKTSYLMEYIGYDGVSRSPVYKLISKMGFRSKGRIVKEYGLEQSMFKRNQVIEITDEKIINIISKDPMYSYFNYVYPNNRELVINKRFDEETEENEGLIKDQMQLPITSRFQGYKGGFEDKGKGTPQGDGKDKAMREVATTSITEVMDRNKQSSSYTTEKTLPWDTNKTIDGIVMLARNKEFTGRNLEVETKTRINEANERGAQFVVGDMPNVDSQFIDYLQETGAKFTIYHTGSESRIKIDKPIISNIQLEIESLKTEISESGVYTEDQIKELNELIDNTEVKSIEDLNELINKICNQFGSPKLKLSLGGKNRFSIND
jgi:hypothetical protein